MIRLLHCDIFTHLGTAQEFKRKFENPILRGRDADATDSDHKKGNEKLQEVRYINNRIFLVV